MVQAQLSSKPTGNVRAYIDDISVQGHINDIEDTLKFMVQQSSKIGIKFKASKIKILIGDCSKEEALERINRYQAIFSNSIPMANFSIPCDEPSTRGIEILTVPIGTFRIIDLRWQRQLSSRI